ncbi:Mediator of RNA polymerase II transcription subunit 7 [Coemansia javaensis]|uniref:Mediator of RNA polymerase II transcription subunit 7 n=1 Tax=Coemansia javaensis TaxID=2761396 RepID=A0A9W8HB56_9FUNG|nr:Mediator of RNA polymerase II transcription subunit 7 [Coemansia javaensis]
MQDAAQAGSGQQLDAQFPAPPDYYAAFTDANLDRLAAVGAEAALEDPELKYLVPPPPPTEGTYSGFGQVWQVNGRLPTLAEQNIAQLYPDGPIDRIAELKRLNHSVVFEFLDLVDVLVRDPSQYGARVERIRDILVNIHHLVNEHRERQAKETLKSMLRQQIESKRLAAERTHAKCAELEQAVARLRADAADTRARLAAEAEQRAQPQQQQQQQQQQQEPPNSTSSAADDSRAKITQDGLAAILEAVQGLE